MNKFDMMSKDALSKMEEIMNASRLSDLLHRKELLYGEEARRELETRRFIRNGTATACMNR